jgi:hypothetical protein
MSCGVYLPGTLLAKSNGMTCHQKTAKDGCFDRFAFGKFILAHHSPVSVTLTFM